DKGGSVTVTTTETIQLDTGSAIDVTATDAAAATIALHAGGDVAIGGTLDASGTALDGGGGTITVDGPPNITGDGTIAARGGSQDGGGTVILTAATLLTVNGTIDVSGGDLNDSSIELDSNGDIVISSAGKLDAHANGGSGFGGTIAATSTGTIDLHGPISGQ